MFPGHTKANRMVSRATFTVSAKLFRTFCDMEPAAATAAICDSIPSQWRPNVAAAVGAWRRVRRDTQLAASYMTSQLEEPRLPEQIVFDA
jgi:hypothetical protein